MFSKPAVRSRPSIWFRMSRLEFNWPSMWKENVQQLKPILRRCFRLVCPGCGQSKIIAEPFRIRHRCPHCYALFKREDVFFAGPLLANIVMTELVILVVCFLMLMLGVGYTTVLVTLILLTMVFPVAFYHHRWSFWLGLDFIVDASAHSNSDDHGS